jgi:hypothetical protein
MDDPSRIDTRNCSPGTSIIVLHQIPSRPRRPRVPEIGNSADTRIVTDDIHHLCHIPYILRTLTVIVPHAQSCVNGPTALNTGT